MTLRLEMMTLALMVASLSACSPPPQQPLQGYVEGEFIMAAAPAGGVLTRLHVRRGDTVAAGAVLFSLENGNEQAARKEAEQRVRGAEQRAANLRAGRRIPEVEVVRAQGAQADAARKLTIAQLNQQEKLFAGGYISQAAIDQSRANHERDMARVAEAEAQSQVAQMAVGRDAEIRAAMAELEAARAALNQGDWRLSQRTVAAPQAELLRVHDTYFLEGEWVPGGRPVLSLLSAGNTKLRFFITEQQLGAIRVGDAVRARCDGCGEEFTANIIFIAAQAEYTPPIIYSKDSRAKLVFMVEARPGPEVARRLRPGQPVDVSLAPTSTPAR